MQASRVTGARGCAHFDVIAAPPQYFPVWAPSQSIGPCSVKIAIAIASHMQRSRYLAHLLLYPAFFLCIVLPFAAATLPALPPRLSTHSAAISAAVLEAAQRCNCSETSTVDLYPNCLANLTRTGRTSPRQHCFPRVVHQTWKDEVPELEHRLYQPT